MKILRVKLILLTLVLSFLGCSSKKKGAFLLPLSQAVQDSIASENSSPTAPSNPSNTSTSSSSTSNTQSTDQTTQSNDSNNQTQNPLPNVDFQSGASSVFRGYYSDEDQLVAIPVNLSNASTQTVTVTFVGNITSGPTMYVHLDHYSLPSSNTLTFNPGETTKSIQVLIKAEGNIGCENYSSSDPHILTLTLSNPTNANLGNITVHNLTIWRNASCE